jgi:hypothetical protein
MLQVQNPSGLLSNEIPICTATGTNNTALAVCIND